MANMTKKDLVSGMFGNDSDGDLFVVAGSILMYEDGLYDDIADMDDNMKFPSGAHIAELYEAKCFAAIRDGNATVIWKREEEKPEAAEKPTGAITITVEEFLKVAEKVNAEWMRVAEEKEDMGIVGAIVGIQNTTFAAHLASELFG